MTALHVVVQPRAERAPHPSLARVYGLFDVIVDGVNITARVGEVDALSLLSDFAQALAKLMTSERRRQTLQLHTELETWEIGLEADGDQVLLTVYRERPVTAVAVWERAVAITDLRQALLTAIDDAKNLPSLAERRHASIRSALAGAHSVLSATTGTVHGPRTLKARTLPWVGESQFRMAAGALLRRSQDASVPSKSCVETADLHSLLAQGTLRFELATQEVRADRAQLFLDAEQLLALSRELWSNVEASRPIFRRTALSEATLTLRWSPEPDRVELRVRCDDPETGRNKTVFAEISPQHFCNTACDFARSLCTAFVVSDENQSRNLRLKALLSQVETLAQRVNQDASDESLTNPDPQSYRHGSGAARQRRPGMWDQGGKMRFLPRWVATVPGIDLNATFLCGDRLVIGSNRETACLDRQSGSILWRKPTSRAKSVVSSSGLLRIEPDGRLNCLSLESGESRFELGLMPRPGAAHTGSVVDTPGLPKLLAVTEGDRQVTAIDLPSGRVRWRYTAPRAASLRAKRAGKLLLVGGQDPTLVALDVSTGEVVWRNKQRMHFTGEMSLDRDSIFAITGSIGGRYSLLHIETWTGRVCWSTEMEERPQMGRLPLVTPNVIAIPARDEQGCSLRAYDRNTGALLWQHGSALAAPVTAWLAVDDCILGNTAAGVLLCVDAATGATRYSHVFSRNAGGDQPRRLEPVLRSGALFVPQQQVHVLRPRDGELLGTLPSDLIPDLIRVDERCDVYIAEDSGHVAALGAAPRLTLIKT
ncbi:MAG TPA: PQQ-binding-like beta-propeller repeat protein [Polyangiaceae bacterium]|nr:PQQ-binding-like beta-propeller repeat protein [Polyangiaceae bacterium]